MVPRVFESPPCDDFAEDIADNRTDLAGWAVRAAAVVAVVSPPVDRPAPSDGVPGNGDHHEGIGWLHGHHKRGPAANNHSSASSAKACHTLAIRAVIPAKCIDDG